MGDKEAIEVLEGIIEVLFTILWKVDEKGEATNDPRVIEARLFWEAYKGVVSATRDRTTLDNLN